MAKTDNLTDFLTDVAEAIREKTATTDKINPQDFSDKIRAIETGGGGEASTGQYLCQVIDYDGTVLKQEYHNEGDTFTLLDAFPTHERLVAQQYSSPVDLTSDLTSATNSAVVPNSDLTIGITYTTASGNTEFDITLTKVTGLTVTLQNLTGMTSIDWGDGNSDSILTHTYAEYGDYTISVSGVTSLGEYIFSQLSSSKNYYCTAVRLPSSVTTIGTYAFHYCCSLSSITIPSGVTTIGTYAFQSCYSLTSITIPSGVTTIGNYAFSGCYSLSSITIPSGVTIIGTYAFQSCYSLTSITIPSGVTFIGNYAFQSCYSLTSIPIPSGVTTIETYAFQSCYSLTSITIPSGVTTIGNYAFQSCYSLTSITIPSGVTTIGTYAFRYCYSCIKYDFSEHTSVPALSSTNAFTNINFICKIIVPDGLYDDWISATNWSTYADYIYKASEV